MARMAEIGSETAADAGLKYVHDHDPGIRRIGAPGRFDYRDPARPPGARRRRRWSASAGWRSRRPGPTSGSARAGAATSRRSAATPRGRKQYRYHDDWRAARDAHKYHRMAAFGRALPKLRARVDADLARRGLPREKVLAAAVRLLEITLIRVGNDEYARANKSFGLTTLRKRHVTLTRRRRGASSSAASPARRTAPASTTGAWRGSCGAARTCPASGSSSTWTRMASGATSRARTSTPTCARRWARTSRPRTSAPGPPPWPPRRRSAWRVQPSDRPPSKAHHHHLREGRRGPAGQHAERLPRLLHPSRACSRPTRPAASRRTSPPSARRPSARCCGC